MLPSENVIGEPMGRDTAAAVALAAALVKARDPQGVFLILTADHVIGDLLLFQQTLRIGLDLAAGSNQLVTIGLAPTEPSTAYGYIERAELHEEREGCRFYRAVRFVEKPNRERATNYLASGKYLWNSGMFIWSVTTIETALKKFRPALGSLVDQWAEAARTGQLGPSLSATYPALEKISIDYAVMEKADTILVAEGRFAWDDVGSWTALEHHFPKNEEGNVVVGQSATWDSSSNIVVSRDRLTALVGVKDLVVVQAEGVTLVCHRDQAQNIKKMLETIRLTGRYTELL
jgi:mannose-1-phosphate guanylyltransferase